MRRSRYFQPNSGVGNNVRCRPDGRYGRRYGLYTADNDCSLRGAIIAANANVSADPVIIDLQPATTYNLTLTNATQENAAATGDLDITTSLHTAKAKVTVVHSQNGSPAVDDGPHYTVLGKLFIAGQCCLSLMKHARCRQ